MHANNNSSSNSYGTLIQNFINTCLFRIVKQSIKNTDNRESITTFTTLNRQVLIKWHYFEITNMCFNLNTLNLTSSFFFSYYKLINLKNISITTSKKKLSKQNITFSQHITFPHLQAFLLTHKKHVHFPRPQSYA